MSPLNGDTVALPPNLGDPDPTLGTTDEKAWCSHPSPPTPVQGLRGPRGGSLWLCTLLGGHPGTDHVCGDGTVVVAVWGADYYRGWEELTALQRREIQAKTSGTVTR